MLEKIATIADIADKNGNHQLADDLTNLIKKQANFFEAFRTLFDPTISGLDSNSSYWKRLQRGWQKGKIDKGVGLLLAINAERTKTNKKIEQLSEPIRDFQNQINDLYNKLRSGNSDLNASNLKNELKEIQNSLKDMTKLVNSKELKDALRLRDKLQEQQSKALDKVRGLDDESKEYLASVLKAEPKFDLTGRGPLGSEPQNTMDPDYIPRSLRSWLKKFNVPTMPIYADAKTPGGKQEFKEFKDTYGVYPKALIEYLRANEPARTEGYKLFGRYFNEMLQKAINTTEYDDKLAAAFRRQEEVPGSEFAQQSSKEKIKDESVKKPMEEKLKRLSDEPAKPSLIMWLNDLDIERQPIHGGAGAKSGKGWGAFQGFAEKYGYTPKAITSFFENNQDKNNEGFKLFGPNFGELLRHANQVQIFDDEIARGIHKSLSTQKDLKPLFPDDIEKPSAATEISAPTSQTSQEQNEKDVIDILKREQAQKELSEQKRKKRQQEAEDLAKQMGRVQKMVGPLSKNPLGLAPSSENTEPSLSPIETTRPLATSKAERVEREIVRLGRMRKLKKIAEPDQDADIFDAFPEGRETFDEERQYDPAQMMLDEFEDVQMEDFPELSDDEKFMKAMLKLERMKLKKRLEQLERNIGVMEQSEYKGTSLNDALRERAQILAKLEYLLGNEYD